MRFEKPQFQESAPDNSDHEEKETNEGNERKETMEKCVENAGRVIEDFLEVREGERVLFLTEFDPFYTDRGLVDAFQGALQKKNIAYSELVADSKTKKRDLFKAMKAHDVIFNTWGMEDAKINFYDLTDFVEENKKRMAWVAGVKADTLDEGGSMTEDRRALEERLGKMEAKLKDVAGFHIRTSYGTDLWIKMKPEERRWFKDAGVILPGKWDNIPGGEIFTVPDDGHVDGVLMLPVLQEEVAKEQGVDKFVRIAVKNGKTTTIDGGESAEKLRKYLEEHSREEEHPENVLQCAEIGFGANQKARDPVTNPEGAYTDIMHPTMESEKRFGTMHIAFGSSKFGEEGAEGHTEAETHLDFVVVRPGPTVTAFRSYDDFINRKNGERLIDEGRWRFFQ